MKAMALKAFIGLFAVFAAYYAFFLGSIAYELYGPNARFCGTAQAWALQGAAILFAPTAVLGSVGLWFAGGKKQALGTLVRILSRVLMVILLLCAAVNLVVFIPGG